MRIVSDFHIHGRFSRATSKHLDIPSLEKWARVKGLNLLGTGDFTHPEWLKEIKAHLTEDGSGVLKTKGGFSFLLQTELSSIYTQDGKGRRVHNVVLAPALDVVEQINAELLKRGRLDYDGRPIFGIPCPELVEMLKGIDKGIEVIPAHAWTPWFSIFGSKSGFDSVEECFGDQAKHIFALETGLSSDPPMNWRLSALDRYALVSNSDCHSFWPWRIGREANVFELDRLTYRGFIQAMKERDPKRFLYTIEVDPSYGKYHLDGHRACNVCLEPGEAAKQRSLCPVCGRPLTIGVLHRVEELADRPAGFKPPGAIPFKSLIPLSEIIAKAKGTDMPASQKVWGTYNKMIKAFGSELEVLLNASREGIAEAAGQQVAEMVLLVRKGELRIKPGYDGVYGRPLFGEEEAGPGPAVAVNKQKNLADF